MAGSAYHRVARLGTHPAFCARRVALVCPRGCDGAVFDRFAAYDRHVLEHDLTHAEAWRWLDARTYDRLAARRGWTGPPDESTSTPTAAGAASDRGAGLPASTATGRDASGSSHPESD